MRKMAGYMHELLFIIDHLLYFDFMLQDFSLESVPEKCFSYFSTKTYVVGTQKNRFNETVLLSTQNIC